MKPLKLIRTKFLNRRVEICIYDKDGEYSVRVFTKRLIDFKERKISSSDTFYSLEPLLELKTKKKKDYFLYRIILKNGLNTIKRNSQ